MSSLLPQGVWFTPDPDSAIDSMAAVIRHEIHEMAEAARDEIDRRLGYSEAFINRARAQRRRHARERATKEKQ